MIIIACDHAGFNYKLKLIEFLEKQGHAIKDMGALVFDENDSYIEYGSKACEEFCLRAKEENNTIILICGSGVGMSMLANRYKEIRAVNTENVKKAKLAREHNNANCLCLGARLISLGKAKKITKAFLSEKFLGGKHESRVKSLAEIKIVTKKENTTKTKKEK